MLQTSVATAANKPEQLPADVLPWLLVLLGVIIIGGAIIYFVRRWFAGDSASTPVGFTLQDLRDLHARGELTDEQYQSARATMIGRLKSTPDEPERSKQ